MKSIKRILLGIISSLLLAVGFVRAAGDLDPMSSTLSSEATSAVVDRAGDPCTLPCIIDDNS